MNFNNKTSISSLNNASFEIEAVEIESV